MGYGVILLRAQPVHNGHLNLIEQAFSENDNLLIVIGSANKERTKRNPLPIAVRRHILEEALEERKLLTFIKIMELPDWSMENAYQYAKEWGSFFYYNIVKEIGTKKFTLYYNDDIETVKNWFIPELAERITIKTVPRDGEFSSTKVRQAIMENDRDYLIRALPTYAFIKRGTLRSYLEKAINDDYIMN